MKFENATFVPGSWDIPSGHVVMTLGTYDEMINKIAKYEAFIKLFFEESSWLEDSDKLGFFLTLARHVDWIKENFPEEYERAYEEKKAKREKDKELNKRIEEEIKAIQERKAVENPF